MAILYMHGVTCSSWMESRSTAATSSIALVLYEVQLVDATHQYGPCYHIPHGRHHPPLQEPVGQHRKHWQLCDLKNKSLFLEPTHTWTTLQQAGLQVTKDSVSGQPAIFFGYEGVFAVNTLAIIILDLLISCRYSGVCTSSNIFSVASLGLTICINEKEPQVIFVGISNLVCNACQLISAPDVFVFECDCAV